MMSKECTGEDVESRSHSEESVIPLRVVIHCNRMPSRDELSDMADQIVNGGANESGLVTKVEVFDALGNDLARWCGRRMW